MSADGRFECAYGENASQAPAVFLASCGPDPLALSRFELIEGAALSYNNLVEVDRQLQTITHLAAALDLAMIPGQAMALGTKHGNACGASIAADPSTAIERMLTGDLRAIFGGAIMVSVDVDGRAARTLTTHRSEGRRLLDLVTAPSFTDEAVEILARELGKCRLLSNPALRELDRNSLDLETRTRHVRGGHLEQPNYSFVLDLAHPDVEITGSLAARQAIDLLLAWAIGSTSNSNTVTLVRDGQLLGNGVGQQDRVGGCQLAVARATAAGHSTDGCAAYSDSYFPFPDGPQVLIDAGVRAVFRTTGSVRDHVVRQTFRDAGVVVAQLPDHAARGFFAH